MTRVVVWNEFVHEHEAGHPAGKIYPTGIHGAIAEGLKAYDGSMTVKTATLQEPEHGLSEAVLAETDVLVWWGHAAHEKVDDAVVARVKKHVVGYMKDFLFTPEQARQPISKLSGGERGRLALARILSLPSNLLVLDEPTNDLDLETLDLLQELLTDYQGTIILVSHDRDFLDRVATSVLVAEGDGRWIEYAGGYTDMIAQRGYGIGAEPPVAAVPKAAKPVADAPMPSGASSPKRKLSFKEKHALETLPKRMDELNALKAKIQKEMEDPALYARDKSRFDKLGAAFAKAEKDLAKAEEEWLELEMLREELEG